MLTALCAPLLADHGKIDLNAPVANAGPISPPKENRELLNAGMWYTNISEHVFSYSGGAYG